MPDKTSVKYSVSAILDLLGFSSHLEISSYDLRTNIGQQAVTRLECLDKAIALLTSEKDTYPDYYPDSFCIQRLNDSVLLTMDLDDIFIPSVGNTCFSGLAPNDISKYFTQEQMKDEETFLSSYNNRVPLNIHQFST